MVYLYTKYIILYDLEKILNLGFKFIDRDDL
jgi:hypothetical protein